MHRFAAYALAELQEGVRSGRPPRLDPAQTLQDQAALRGKPADVGLGGNLWNGKDAGRICAPAGGGIAPAPMPQPATAVGVPLPQATPGDRPRRIGATGRAENNFSGSLAKQRWIFGRWMRYISTKPARRATWGCRQRSNIPSCATIHPGKGWATSGLSGCAMAGWSSVRNPSSAPARRRGPSCSSWRGRTVRLAATWWFIIANARCHHVRLHLASRQPEANHLRLDYLPPYGPELNPTERVWELTRKRSIHVEYFPTLAGPILAVEKQFTAWAEPNGDPRRLCSIAD